MFTTNNFWNLIGCLGLCLLLWQCASTGKPNGGEKDTEAPLLVVDKSSPNFKTNFIPNKIELVFNEWIELRNPNSEVLISPPFFKSPKISYRGKKVTVEFPEEEPLRPDATYIINFGNSIVDFTEANPVKDFRYVFSTGDMIDSLSYNGKVVDAYGGEAIANVLVLMYDELKDSVVLDRKPFYYTRTANDGTFKFENLKSDSFNIFVLEDQDINYLKGGAERFAFLDSLIVLNDSTDLPGAFRLYQPEQPIRIVETFTKTPGMLTLVYDRPASIVKMDLLYPQNIPVRQKIIGDSLKLWFSEPIDSFGAVIEEDTFRVISATMDTAFYKKPLRFQGHNTKQPLAPFDSLMLTFIFPIDSIDHSKITLTDIAKHGINDTTKRKNLMVDSSEIGGLSFLPVEGEIDSLVQKTNTTVDTLRNYDFTSLFILNELRIKSAWAEDHSYRLTIQKGGVIDMYGRMNDSLSIDFKVGAYDEYGNISLFVESTDSLASYVLLLTKNKKVVAKRTVTAGSTKAIEFNRLRVGTYEVQLIHDENLDGKWTTGDYWTKRQPEQMKSFKLEPLRENWDLEAVLNWENQKVKAPSVEAAPDSLSIPPSFIETEEEQNDGLVPKGKNK